MTAGTAVLAIALSSAAPPAVTSAEARDPAGPHPVVAPPWADAETLVAAAGGRLSGPRQPLLGRFTVGSDDGFAGRFHAAGARLVLGVSRLPAICGARP